MELKHTFTVSAPIEQTWAALNDIESVAACFPGAAVNSAQDDSFAGSCKVKLGPIAMVYNGSGTFVEKDEAAHTMKIEAKGKDKRGNGTAGASVGVAMSDTDGQTRVEIVTDLAITGRPAQFGRGVMQDVSDKLLGQFVTCLQAKVGADTAPGEDTEAAAPETALHATSTLKASVPQPGAGMPPAAADVSGATAPSPVPTGAPQPTPPTEAQNNDALDLGGAVLPALAKAYWKPALAAGAVIGVIVYIATR